MHKKPHAAYHLHTQLATVREEARRFKVAVHQQLHEALDQLDPLRCLEQAAWLERQARASDTLVGALPLSALDIARRQQAALEHVRASILGLEDLSAQIAYTRGVLFELDLMHDYDEIIGEVRDQVAQILKHLKKEQAASAILLQEALRITRAQLEEAEQTLREHTQGGVVATMTTWLHLARATAILNRHPDLTSKAAFVEAVLGMHAELGLSREDPGGAVWRGVQRLGKSMLQSEHLPEHYCQFEGFRRLVSELIQGSLSDRDNGSAARLQSPTP